MKRKALVLSLFVLVGTLGSVYLASCGPSEQIDTSEDKVTGVEISGPIWVEQGNTITLSVDVLGTDDDRVTWTSSDENIATVSEEGKITGVKEGNVVITATSVVDPNFSSTYNVSVRGVQATGIELVILSEDDDIILNDGVYRIPGGKEFIIGYKLNNENATKPNSIAYNFSFANSTNATSNEYTITQNGDGTATVRFNSVFVGGVLTVAARYTSSVDPELKHSISVESYDKNAENSAKADEIVEKIKEKEISNLVSAKREVLTSTKKEEMSFTSYKDATYGTNKITNLDDESVTTENTYSTNDTSEKAFYYFSYGENKTINEILANKLYSSGEEGNYEACASVPHFMIEGLPAYGFNSLFTSMLTNTRFENSAAFGSFTVRGNADYTFESNRISVISEYTEDSGYDAILKLSISYNESYELSEYSFEYSLKTDDSTDFELVYQEKGSDFTYGEKVEDANKDIDISLYYIKDFKVNYVKNYSPEGSDQSKYEYNKFETNSEGQDAYTMTYDHALPLKVEEINPLTGNVLIDIPAVTVTTPGVETKNLFVHGDGSIVISAPKNNDGDFFEGTSTVVFTTRGGASETILINWVKPTITDITFDYSDDSYNVESTHTFPEIREYTKTDYFWLNTIPDDTTYDFDMVITEGDQDGISLHEYENSGNMDHCPKGSYALEGHKAGTYKFYFYVIGYSNVKTPEYTITVSNGITSEDYAENLVGNSYEYSTGTMDFTLTFTSETVMTLKMPTVLMDTTSDEEVSTVEAKIYYTIEDGKVSINTEENEVNQIFDIDNGYFESAYGGAITISEDFSTISLKLRLRSDSTKDPYNYNYNVYTFKKVVDFSSLSGKTVSSERFVTGHGMCTFTLTFLSDTNAKLEIVTNSNNTFVGGATFDYNYDADAISFTTSNIVMLENSDDGFSFLGAEMYSKNVLRLKLSFNGSSYAEYCDIDLSSAS